MFHVKARSTEPRRFGNPLAAMKVLRDIGITAGQFDASEYDPADKVKDAGNRGRAKASIVEILRVKLAAQQTP